MVQDVLEQRRLRRGEHSAPRIHAGDEELRAKETAQQMEDKAMEIPE
jgi:hypothetical protein